MLAMVAAGSASRVAERGPGPQRPGMVPSSKDFEANDVKMTLFKNEFRENTECFEKAITKTSQNNHPKNRHPYFDMFVNADLMGSPEVRRHALRGKPAATRGARRSKR